VGDDEYVSKGIFDATRDAIVGTQKIQLEKIEGLEKEQKNQTGKIEVLTDGVHGMREEFGKQFARINGKEEGRKLAETKEEKKRRERRELLNTVGRWVAILVIIGTLVFAAGKFVGSMVEGAVEKVVNGKTQGGGE
jgi:hypothetical protein